MINPEDLHHVDMVCFSHGEPESQRRDKIEALWALVRSTHYEPGQGRVRKGGIQSGWGGEVVGPFPWAAVTEEGREAGLRTTELRTQSAGGLTC